MRRFVAWVEEMEVSDLADEARRALERGDLQRWAELVHAAVFGESVDVSVPRIPEKEGHDVLPRLSFPLPIYAMVLRPTDAQADGWHVWVTGYHLRYKQNEATLDRVLRDLDAAHARGKRAGVVIAVHSEQSGPHTEHTRRMGDRVIPDYWSTAMFDEWIQVRSRIIPKIADHPALAWIGGDFGMDDESWPTKPWTAVPSEMRWTYALRYRDAMWALAKMAPNVPVLAQAATMFKQGLDILFLGSGNAHSPANLGFKFNGFKPRPGLAPGLEERIRPYWEWCKTNGRTVALEPGMVPTGDEETDYTDARAMIDRAVTWGAEFLNLQRPYLQVLDKRTPRG